MSQTLGYGWHSGFIFWVAVVIEMDFGCHGYTMLTPVCYVVSD